MIIYERVILSYDLYYACQTPTKDVINTIELVDYIYDDKGRLTKRTAERYSIALNKIHYSETTYKVGTDRIKNIKYDDRVATEMEKRRFYKAWHREIVRRLKFEEGVEKGEITEPTTDWFLNYECNVKEK